MNIGVIRTGFVGRCFGASFAGKCQSLPSGDIAFCDDEYAASRGCGAIVVVTEWNPFRSLNLKRKKEVMRAANMIDWRNIYELEAARNLGSQFISSVRG